MPEGRILSVRFPVEPEDREAKVTRLDHLLDGLRAVIAVLVLALTTITCHAQALPDAPSVGILTPFNPTARESVDLNLLRTDALLRVGDFVTTFEFLKNPCVVHASTYTLTCLYEADPLSKPFTFDHGKGIALFQAVAYVGVAEVYKHLSQRHHRIARSILIADIISESLAVSHNAQALHSR